MRRLMIVASAATLFAATSFSALAEEASGQIESIDVGAGTVTLADGSTYLLPAGFDAATLEVGAEVTIFYEETQDGALMASDVEAGSM